MTITRWQALTAAASAGTWAAGMCDNFCANMYGFSASGYVDAVAHWERLPGSVRHPGDTGIPPGMLAFWGGGHGHVAISDGKGYVWSTDISGAGTVSRVPLSRITSLWGKPYLGWGEPVFQDVMWSDMQIPGCDIAGYQAVSGWEGGKDFVVIKITEGTSYTNPNWTGQRATARVAGLVRGYYHFARNGSMTDQADFFLSRIDLDLGEFIALDWEDPMVSSPMKDAWIRYVQEKAPGHKVVLYCNRDYWINRDTSGFRGDGLWIADPDVPAGQPRVQAPWLIHQYSEAGGLDRDTALFDNRAAMLSWASGEEVFTMNWTDTLNIPAGAWSDQAENNTAGNWIVYANKKAEKASGYAAVAASQSTTAASKAAAALAQSVANGAALSAVTATVNAAAAAVTALETTGLTPEQVAAISTGVAAAIMSDAFLTALANKMADVNAARMAE